MKKISSGYSSDSEQNNKQDLSILRKPISTGLSGFLESKRAYDNGTEEMRRLLSKECDILYECKVCRNMFRSMTNFISHKRVYCRAAFSNLSNHFNINNGCLDQDVSTIIQEEKEFVSTTKENRNNENSNKDLSSIIERLLKREQANRLMKLTDFYDQVSSKLTQDELLRKRHELQLDRVPNSSVAVYQTVRKENSDNIKKEVNEINELVYNRKTVIGSDGKVIVNEKKSIQKHNQNTYSKENSQKLKEDDEAVSCDVCNLKFSTEKTLRLHIQTKHIASTFVYQCPSCSQTFLQPRAVFSHLSNDHKKSIRRVRMMRDSILKRRVRTDEIQAKGPSRELARLQIDNEKRDAENKAWMNNSEMANTSPMCAYCGKTFERKAVLTTHLNNCPMKNKCPGPQTRRFANVANSGTNNKNENNASNVEHFLNDNDLNELRDIRELDRNSTDDYPSAAASREGSPINKRKRKRTNKVLQPSEAVSDVTESLNELLWNINASTEKMSLKTVTFDESPSVTPPLDVKPATEKTKEPPEKVCKNLELSASVKSHKEVSFYCRICVKKFDVLSNLRRHISMFHYRKRKFGCKVCDYRAFRKYDVINHLYSNHSIRGEKEEVLQYVIVKELKTERNEENIDADVMIDESGKFADENSQKKNVEKKRRGPKSKDASKASSESPPRPPATIIEPKNEGKFTRTSSNLSLSSNEEGSSSSLSKRPIRNRVKPVNKDFVYDLSNLLKKDMVLSEKTHRRRNTQSALDDSSRDSTTPPNVSNGESPMRVEPAEIPQNPDIDPNVKGAALVMARAAVTACAACFYKPPELPLERPSIINRLLPPVTALDSKSAERTTNNPLDVRRLSDDNILHSQKKKRRLENLSSIQASSSDITDILSPKIEVNINGDTHMKLLPDRTQDEVSESEKIIVKLFSTEEEFKERLLANKLTEPGNTSSSSALLESLKLPSSTLGSTNGFGASTQSQQLLGKSSSNLTLSPTKKRITIHDRLI